MTSTDLATYPLMFLIGFSFLAAFLTKLSDLIVRPFEDKETLVAKFKKADIEKLRQSKLAEAANAAAADNQR